MPSHSNTKHQIAKTLFHQPIMNFRALVAPLDANHDENPIHYDTVSKGEGNRIIMNPARRFE